MIYLIDDKKKRQENDFKWTSEKFHHYTEYIKPIYSLEEVSSIADVIFDKNNIVLYHESFLDNSNIKNESAIKRDKLEQYALNHPSFKLVIFSGSKSTRNLNENIAHLPVSVVYQNLKIFIERYIKDESNLEYLVYGENPKIEPYLLEKLESVIKNDEEPAIIENQSTLFVPTYERYIENPIKNAFIPDFYDQENDEEITDFINCNFNIKKFDNIFIPLCYGSSLSDYNGLRLATHIRCTSSMNQLSRIFIYGFVGMESLIYHTYFNILKTRNIYLIPFSKKSFKQYAELPLIQFSIEELHDQLSLLKLDVPNDYEDNHSIANEWAIYRWSKFIGVDLNDELKIISNKIEHNLYFKYLRTIHPIDFSKLLTRENLKIKAKSNPKILLIDDEANKGWNELFAYLLTDINGFYSDYIGDGFKNLTSEEIIDESIKKIKDDDIDIVLLDFRLNQEDFNNKNPEDNTSVKLLKQIKGVNPGIQVIIFSATNKIWNYLVLQDGGKGADGFVLKESPENSINGNITIDSIYSLIEELNNAVKRNFLIKYFTALSNTKYNLTSLDYLENTKYHKFILGLISQLNVIIEISRKTDLLSESSLDIVFLNCFNFLEQYKDYYLRKIKYSYYLGHEETELKRYSRKGTKICDQGSFLLNSYNDSPSWFNIISALLIDYFEICEIDDALILDLENIKNERNKFIHNTKKHFNVDELMKIVHILSVISANMKE